MSTDFNEKFSMNPLLWALYHRGRHQGVNYINVVNPLCNSRRKEVMDYGPASRIYDEARFYASVTAVNYGT